MPKVAAFPLTRMLSHVNVQIARVREALAAQVAFERLFEGVLAHVNGQIARVRECLVADVAFDALLARVYSLVHR